MGNWRIWNIKMNQEINPEITIIGLWHQGVVAAACLADLGFNITAADLDQKKMFS